MTDLPNSSYDFNCTEELIFFEDDENRYENEFKSSVEELIVGGELALKFDGICKVCESLLAFDMVYRTILIGLFQQTG